MVPPGSLRPVEGSGAVDRYLAGLPADRRAALERLRASIARLVPEATEGISYGMPAFKLRGHPLVGYANAKHHCALYGMSAGLEPFASRLTAFSTSKGTIRFTPDAPIPDDVVEDLVRFRVGEIDARWPA
jgi:uncharacterized protein YdhG (YjbR/CyaY superfamily)